nr:MULTISPECIES: TonB-dependent receptor [unclassified Novosphingobium]
MKKSLLGRPHLAASCVSLVALVSYASPVLAQAQDTPAKSAPQAPEIIVTAQYRSQALQTIPLAVTAVSSEQMKQRNQLNLVDLAASAPSVTIQQGNSGYGATPSVAIRGIGANDYNFALEPAVGIYVDDVYQPTLFGSALDLMDLQRVEILRGPQGTLAGRNSIGGTVKLVSSPVTNELGGSLTAAYGSANKATIRGILNLPLTDTLAVRVSGYFSRQDGYVDRLDYGCLHPNSGVAAQTTAAGCKLGTEGGTKHFGTRVALRWTPTDRLEVNLSGDLNFARDEPAGTILIAARDTYAPFSNKTNFPQFVTGGGFVNYSTYAVPEENWSPGAYSRSNSHAASLKVEYKISDTVSLTSISAYTGYTAQFTNDADGGPLNASLEQNDLTFDAYSQELRLSGKIGAFDWIVGGYFFNGDGVQAGRFNLGFTGPAFLVNADTQYTDFTQGDIVKSKSRAVFAHTDWHLADRTTLTVGARYTHESKDYHFIRAAVTVPESDLNASVNGLTGTYSKGIVDFRVSLDQRWTPDVMTYATFSTGFRGGGVNPRPFVPSQIASFGPEKLYNFELGTKSSLFDRRVQLNAAAFYDIYNDFQRTITNGYGGFPASAIPLNSGDGRLYGFELELSARATNAWSFDGSASYTRFKTTRLSADAQASGVTETMDPIYMPRWRANFGTQYEFDLGTIGSLTPRIDANYQSDLFTNTVNAEVNRLKGRTIFNAHLTWKSADKLWRAALDVSNLTDKYYYLNIDDTLQGKGTVRATPARPRQFVLTVERKF